MKKGRLKRHIGNLPIKRKLHFVIMLTSVVVICLSTFVLVGSKLLLYQKQMVDHLSTLARVIGQNTAAAMKYHDAYAMQETLVALRAEPLVRSAAIADTANVIVAAYHHPEHNAPWQSSRSPGDYGLPSGHEGVAQGQQFRRNSLIVWRPIVLDQEFVGTIYLQAGLTALWASLIHYLSIGLLVLVSASFMAYFLSRKFEGFISVPILGLVDTVKQVSAQQNYTLRAPKQSDDELGTLIDSFNQMLGQIQAREQELERHHLTLASQIRQRTAELEQANQELQKAVKEIEAARLVAEGANSAKSEFLANMSHELRTPLNHIIGFVELVVDKSFGELNATQIEYLTDALESSRHLLSLINDILDLSKVEAGKFNIDVNTVELRPLLENSLVMVKPKALQDNIRVATQINSIPETIAADERKLKQILYNLLSNAVKFTPTGGDILLRADTVDDLAAAQAFHPCKTPTHQKGEQRENRSGAPPYIRIQVVDSGIGLAAADLERIFAPFEQVESSKSRRYSGTGLGLALSKKLAELHAGRLWASSAGPGQGSTFTLLLPRDAPRGASPPADMTADTSDAG